MNVYTAPQNQPKWNPQYDASGSYTPQNPWLSQYNSENWKYNPQQDDRALWALQNDASSGFWQSPWGPMVAHPYGATGNTGMQYYNGGQRGQGWRSLPGGINYNELPWLGYLQGQRTLPYWRGPQGMPVPSTQAWNRISPSEQGMYQGMLETQGVNMPDFQAKMQRLAPSWGNALPQINWR